MNSFNLLFDRIRQNWKFHYGIFKTVIDWTVMVYLIVPAIVIGAFIYHSWWSYIPYWIIGIPYTIFFLILFFFLWGGNFQTFVREADGVYLRKNECLLLRLKQGGILYSFIMEWILATFLFFIISPFWIKYYEMSIGSLILFQFMWMSLKWLIMAVKGRMNVLATGWRNIFRSLPLVIIAIIIWYLSYKALALGNIMLMISIILLNVLISLLLIRRRFISIETFEQDLAIDEMEKTKYINLIFGMSMDMDKMQRQSSIKRRPSLYSRSNRIFKYRTPTKGFLELFIKATTRNTEYIFGFLKITGITTAAIIAVPPIWLRLMIICLAYIFLISWIGSVWHKLIGDHPFTKKYKEDIEYFQGKRMVTIILSIPFVGVVICIFIIRMWILSLFSFL